MLNELNELMKHLRGNTIRTKLTLQLKGKPIDKHNKSDISEHKNTFDKSVSEQKSTFDMPNRSYDKDARFLGTYKQCMKHRIPILRTCMHLTMMHTCSPCSSLLYPHTLTEDVHKQK
jgi:hypothetical protein